MSFCHQCEQVSVAEAKSAYHAETMPVGYCGLARLCDPGDTVDAICDGCGMTVVDHKGRCLNGCPEHADEGFE